MIAPNLTFQFTAVTLLFPIIYIATLHYTSMHSFSTYIGVLNRSSLTKYGYTLYLEYLTSQNTVQDKVSTVF